MPLRPIKMPLLLFLLLSRNLTPSSQYAFQWTLPHPQIPATPQLRVSNQSKQAKDPSQPLQSSRQPHLHLSINDSADPIARLYATLHHPPNRNMAPTVTHTARTQITSSSSHIPNASTNNWSNTHTSPPQSSLSSSLTSHAPLNEHTDTRSLLSASSLSPLTPPLRAHKPPVISPHEQKRSPSEPTHSTADTHWNPTPAPPVTLRTTPTSDPLLAYAASSSPSTVFPTFTTVPTFESLSNFLSSIVTDARRIPCGNPSEWKPAVQARWSIELTRLGALFDVAIANPS